MKRKIIWLVVSCLMVAVLLLVSCAPAVTEEEEVIAPPEEEEEVVTEEEVVEEVVEEEEEPLEEEQPSEGPRLQRMSWGGGIVIGEPAPGGWGGWATYVYVENAGQEGEIAIQAHLEPSGLPPTAPLEQTFRVQAGKKYKVIVVVHGFAPKAGELTAPLKLVVKSPSGLYEERSLDIYGTIYIRSIQLEEYVRPVSADCVPEGGPVKLTVTMPLGEGPVVKLIYPRVSVYMRIKNEGGTGEVKLSADTIREPWGTTLETKWFCFEKGKEYNVEFQLHPEWIAMDDIESDQRLDSREEVLLSFYSSAGGACQQTLSFFRPEYVLKLDSVGGWPRVASIIITPVTPGEEFPPPEE